MFCVIMFLIQKRVYECLYYRFYSASINSHKNWTVAHMVWGNHVQDLMLSKHIQIRSSNMFQRSKRIWRDFSTAGVFYNQNDEISVVH